MRLVCIPSAYRLTTQSMTSLQPLLPFPGVSLSSFDLLSLFYFYENPRMIAMKHLDPFVRVRIYDSLCWRSHGIARGNRGRNVNLADSV
jgi:hypothetical protein